MSICNCIYCAKDRSFDDWEATGKNEILEQAFKQGNKEIPFDPPPNPTSIRDRLEHLETLVDVCTIALTHQDYKAQQCIQTWVAGVLGDYVTPEIRKAQQELRRL